MNLIHYLKKKKERFFDYWTLKESFIKNVGKGLYYGLHKFSIILGDNILNQF